VSGILDEREDPFGVDLASRAYEIWKQAITADPSLEQKIKSLDNVVYSTRAYMPTQLQPEGALVYVQTGQGNDHLAWVDKQGRSITENQAAILEAAACSPDAPAIPRHENHHELVAAGVRQIVELEQAGGGSLGKKTGARYRTYERLKAYAADLRGTLFDTVELNKAIDHLLKFPLLQTATDTLNRRLRENIETEPLIDLVLSLHRDGRLCRVLEDGEASEAKIICSLGLRQV
jgi:hypothetical protein